MLRSFRTTSSRELSHEHAAPKSVSVTEQSSQAQGKRIEAYTGSFNDPVIDLASDTRKLPSTLLLSRNGANRSKYDINLSDLPSMNSIAHEMSFVRHSSMGSIHVQSLRRSFCIRSLFHRRTSLRCVVSFRKRRIISQTIPLPTPTPPPTNPYIP